MQSLANIHIEMPFVNGKMFFWLYFKKILMRLIRLRVGAIHHVATEIVLFGLGGK